MKPTHTQTCAIYARYSSEKQSPTSIADQVRKCKEYAARQSPALLVADAHIYADEGISGASAERPELARMLRAATGTARPFDVILADDTSRISRNLGDAIHFYERLNFHGVRVVIVAQNIDSSDDGADVALTFNGLMDSRFIKALAQKTHRGMEGQVLRGFYPAGRCFGYRNVRTPEGSRLEIEPGEAAIVQRVFELSACGASYRTIAKTLNAERVPSPRPRAGKQFASWCPTAIREMLYRELYAGRIVWNRSRFVKVPGTNRRVRRARPQSEWCTVAHAELRIVTAETWNTVQARLKIQRRIYDKHNLGSADFGRLAGNRHLLTGFLKCALCSANLVIVGGRNALRNHPKYGCPNHWQRGTCANDLRERQDRIEPVFLRELQRAVMDSGAIEHAIAEFTRRLQRMMKAESAGPGRIEARKAALAGELERLTLAVAQGGHSPALLHAIGEREKELRELEARATEANQAAAFDPADVRAFVLEEVASLPGLFKADVSAARRVLASHVSEVRMHPHKTHDGRCYEASGTWSLLGRVPENGPWVAPVRATHDGCGGQI